MSNEKDKDGPILSAEDMVKQHIEARKALVQKENQLHFSYQLEASLTDDERKASEKLRKMRDEIVNEESYNSTIHNFYQNKQRMEECKLFKALNTMPKGALHHIHTTAAIPIEAYVKLTYDERTYYSERDQLFKVYPKHLDVDDGYIKCTELRKFYNSPEDFDKKLRQEILLTAKEADNKDSHDIWKDFQQKFTKVGQLSKFIPFFKETLKVALQSCIKQNVFVVEYRHISGMLFDDDKTPTPFEEELKIIKGVVDELKKDTPHFELMLVLTGLKIIGTCHVKKILGHVEEATKFEDKSLVDMIAGFDLVNEEDFTPQIGSFSKEILEAQQLFKHLTNRDMPCFFHSGETHNRDVTNLQDALLLNTKRIGHGFQIQLFPYLQKQIIEKDICIECCPLSNFVLGYTKDLRTHPVSFLMNRGVQVSISSDDPGLFGYEGVTLDYVYATGAWGLTLRDLKQMSLNGIKYSSVNDEKKKELMKVFEPKWAQWVKSINEDKN